MLAWGMALRLIRRHLKDCSHTSTKYRRCKRPIHVYGTLGGEKLFGVKTLDKAVELQTEFARSAYEGFVAKAAKIGEIYADLAKETYKPFESMVAKAK